MSSPIFWKVLDECFRRFKIPYTVFILRQEVVMLDLSRKDKLKLQSSSIFLLVNTIYCFACLCWSFKQKEAESHFSIEQLLLILLSFTISGCFMSIHFVNSFRREVFPAVFNTVFPLEQRISSKFLNILKTSMAFIFPTFLQSQIRLNRGKNITFFCFALKSGSGFVATPFHSPTGLPQFLGSIRFTPFSELNPSFLGLIWV